MKAEQVQYTLITNGIPDYGKIPKATLEPIAKKFLEDILKWQKERNRRTNSMQEIRNSQGKLVCRVDKASKTVEIVLKGCITLIRFFDDGTIRVINKDNAA